jgi:hypothetical protein
MPVIPALGKLRQEDHECEARLGLHRETLTKKKETNKNPDWHMPVIQLL